MAQGSVGAGNRLSAAAEYAAKQAAKRLAPNIEAANKAAYLAQMQRTARAFGRPEPHAITDQAILDRIAANALVSAQSITQTQAAIMASLVAQFGSRAAAQDAFSAWEKSQRAAIAQYESAQTTHAALADFHQRNDLTGMEHLEPQDTAGLDDECDEALALGDVPIGTLGDTWPAHFRCPHFIQRDYDPPEDASALWFGAD